MARIDPLVDEMMSLGGSDLHVAEGQPPKIRRHGELVALDHPVLTAETMRGYLEEVCPPDRWKKFMEVGDLDFAFSLNEKARFRTNFFKQSHGLAAVFRTIPAEIKSIEELNLPSAVRSFALLRSGLVLVTGPTGSGKSTTLAAIINLINENSCRHILTIEEPVEFVHPNKKSIVCHREVGMDVNSFAEGLRVGARQDCDVIMVGEMRDYETISLAVTAASMGVLVFGTLSTVSAGKTVDRIIDVFPAGKQTQVRGMLADSLKGVCAQILLRTADGTGRVPCNEILLSNTALSNSIREGNTPNIRNIILGSRNEGMQVMDDSIFRALTDKRISPEDAYVKAVDKSRFTAALRESQEGAEI